MKKIIKSNVEFVRSLNVFYFGVSETDIKNLPSLCLHRSFKAFCFQILIASAPQRGRASNLHKRLYPTEGWQDSLFRKDLPSVIELNVHRLVI